MSAERGEKRVKKRKIHFHELISRRSLLTLCAKANKFVKNKLEMRLFLRQQTLDSLFLFSKRV